jgi:chemotaxis protein histidine kinase CheA
MTDLAGYNQLLAHLGHLLEEKMAEIDLPLAPSLMTATYFETVCRTISLCKCGKLLDDLNARAEGVLPPKYEPNASLRPYNVADYVDSYGTRFPAVMVAYKYEKRNRHTTWARLTASGQLRLHDSDIGPFHAEIKSGPMNMTYPLNSGRVYTDTDVQILEMRGPFNCLAADGVHILQAYVVYVLLRRGYSVPLKHLPLLLEESFSRACELICEGVDHSKPVRLRRQALEEAKRKAAEKKAAELESQTAKKEAKKAKRKEAQTRVPGGNDAEVVVVSATEEDRIAKLESQAALLQAELTETRATLSELSNLHAIMDKLNIGTRVLAETLNNSQVRTPAGASRNTTPFLVQPPAKANLKSTVSSNHTVAKAEETTNKGVAAMELDASKSKLKLQRQSRPRSYQRFLRTRQI